jgi:hypothetical protein
LRSAGVSTRVIGEGATLPPAAQTALGWAVAKPHRTPSAIAIPARCVDLEVTSSDGAEPFAVLQIENDGVRARGDHRPGLAGGNGGGTGLVGLRVEEIARPVSLSRGTVRNYLSAAIAKIGASNRHDAVSRAREHGWT